MPVANAMGEGGEVVAFVSVALGSIDLRAGQALDLFDPLLPAEAAGNQDAVVEIALAEPLAQAFLRGLAPLNELRLCVTGRLHVLDCLAQPLGLV